MDEAGFAQDMPRLHGYATRGERCVGTQDWHARGRVNAIGARLPGSLIAVGLTAANVDADLLGLWLEHHLLPVLPAKAVLVMEFKLVRAADQTIRGIV